MRLGFAPMSAVVVAATQRDLRSIYRQSTVAVPKRSRSNSLFDHPSALPRSRARRTSGAKGSAGACLGATSDRSRLVAPHCESHPIRQSQVVHDLPGPSIDGHFVLDFLDLPYRNATKS